MRLEEQHLRREDFEKLVATDLEPEARKALLHGLSLCPQCRLAGGRLFELLTADALAIDFGIVDLALAESRDEAPVLFEKLMSLDSKERRRFLRKTRSWGLCESLLQKSLNAKEDALDRLDFAQMAVDLSGLLIEDEPCERAWLCQLRGLAGACLAEVERLLGDVEEAEETFRSAQALWEQGEAEAGDVLGYAAQMAQLLSDFDKAGGKATPKGEKPCRVKIR
jgi:hypothetical protein